MYQRRPATRRTKLFQLEFFFFLFKPFFFFYEWEFSSFLVSLITSIPDCTFRTYVACMSNCLQKLTRPANLGVRWPREYIRRERELLVRSGPLRAFRKNDERTEAQLYGQECLIDVTTFEVGGSSVRHFFMSFISVPSLLLFVSRFDCWLLVTPLPFPGYIFSRWFKDSLRNF